MDDSYFANKAQHDAEAPNTDDPGTLARAKKATGFVNGSDSNPFKGMSRDQLALIAYDDSGTFTVSERRAAWKESYSQEEAWRQKTFGKATDEYNRTGKLTNSFSQVLEHYEGLPAIEQAQYPENYANKLREMIDLDFNHMSQQADGKSRSPTTSLIEQLVAAGPLARKEGLALLQPRYRKPLQPRSTPLRPTWHHRQLVRPAPDITLWSPACSVAKNLRWPTVPKA
jgi:hypothetical protein